MCEFPSGNVLTIYDDISVKRIKRKAVLSMDVIIASSLKQFALYLMDDDMLIDYLSSMNIAACWGML